MRCIAMMIMRRRRRRMRKRGKKELSKPIWLLLLNMKLSGGSRRMTA